MKRYLLIFSLFYACFSSPVFGQEQGYRLVPATKENIEFEALRVDFPQHAQDSLKVYEQLDEYIQALHREGYLLASADQIKWTDSTVFVHLHIGNAYRLAYLNAGNLPARWVSGVDKQNKLWRNKPFDYTEISFLLQSVLDQADAKGYPFASVKLDSLSSKEQQLSAVIAFTPGPFITFDTISLEGNVNLSPEFLGAFLGVKRGKPFDQRRIDEVSEKLKQLSFLSLEGPARLTFQNEQAKLYLKLKKRPADVVDGLASVYADPEDENRLKLTGQLQLELNNLFGSAKKLHLYWQKLKPLSQEFRVNYEHPSFLHSPLNVGAEVYILKQDSAFLSRRIRTEISWNQDAHHRFALFSEWLSSDQLSEPVGEMQRQFRNFDQNNYGINWRLFNLNDAVYPTKGSFLQASLSVGDKRLKRADTLIEDDNTRQLQYQLDIASRIYLPLAKRWVLAGKGQGGVLLNKQLYRNDLFRLGGFRSIRGFQAGEFYASHFMLGSAEIQFLLEEESHLMLFYDQALYYDQVRDFRDYPLAIGAGFSLTTRAGVFSLAYALGDSKVQNLGFQTSKVHFGFSSRF